MLRKVLRQAAVASALAISVASAQQIACTCDCDGDGGVAVAELVTAVNILLERAALLSCPAADAGGDGSVGVAELVQGVNAALSGCPDGTPQPTAVPTPTATVDLQLPPTGETLLLSWLQAGHYSGWNGESATHRSGGPHFGQVRTFVNDALLASLEAGSTAHPVGAAAVKELYGSGSEVRGWSVSVKVAEDSDAGRGWYWYERFGDARYADSVGASICTGCHHNGTPGFPSTDLVLTPFPLQ